MWKLLTPTCCCFSRSVVSNSFRPHGLQPTRLLCPWDSPGKNTGVGCRSLLQGIFLTQGSNPSLLHWQACSLPLSHLESPTWLCLKMTHQRCVLRNKRVWWTAHLTSKYGNIKHSAPSARTSQLATNITNTRRAKQQPSIWQTCRCVPSTQKSQEISSFSSPDKWSQHSAAHRLPKGQHGAGKIY